MSEIDFSKVKEWKIGGKNVVKAEKNGVVVWTKPTVPPEEPTYTVSGTWNFLSVFRNLEDNNINQTVLFMSNGTRYNSINFILKDGVDCKLFYGDTQIFDVEDMEGENDDYWEGVENYQTITFDGTQVVSKEFFEWLSEAAGKLEEDPLKGSWLWEAQVDSSLFNSSILYYFNFTSNNNSYNSLSISSKKLYYGNTQVAVYNDNNQNLSWTNGNYRTIEILDEITAVENGYELLEILENNAKRVTNTSHGGGGTN